MSKTTLRLNTCERIKFVLYTRSVAYCGLCWASCSSAYLHALLYTYIDPNSKIELLGKLSKLIDDVIRLINKLLAHDL